MRLVWGIGKMLGFKTDAAPRMVLRFFLAFQNVETIAPDINVNRRLVGENFHPELIL